MPRSKSLVASKCWTLTAFGITLGSDDPSSGSLDVKVKVEIIHDGSIVSTSFIDHTVSGLEMQRTVADAARRTKDFLDAGVGATRAYVRGTRDAIFVLLITDGIVPADSVLDSDSF